MGNPWELALSKLELAETSSQPLETSAESSKNKEELRHFRIFGDSNENDTISDLKERERISNRISNFRALRWNRRRARGWLPLQFLEMPPGPGERRAGGRIGGVCSWREMGAFPKARMAASGSASIIICAITETSFSIGISDKT